MNRDNVRLILKKESVPRSDIRIPRPRPVNLAVVYSTRDGELVELGRQPTWMETIHSPYTMRYEVDLSDHEFSLDVAPAPLLARGDTYSFEATVHVGFRVHDPVTIVRRNVTHGLPVVFERVIDSMRTVSRDFDIEDSADAEKKINGIFEAPVPLDMGITIYRCSARLAPDSKARAYLDAKHQAMRDVQVKQVQHRLNQEVTQYELELERLRHDAEMEHRERELQALGATDLDHRRLLFLHLAEHPEDTERVLSHLAAFEQQQFERADKHEENRIALFKFMIQEDLVNAVDVDQFRREAIGRLHQPADPAALPQSSTWLDEPVPAAAEAAPTEPAATIDVPAVGNAVQDAHGWDSLTGLLPVYVVAEESTLVRPWTADLDGGVAALCALLAKAPDVADRVRLSVLGFAADVTTHLAVSSPREVQWRRPRFKINGRATYAALFQDLLVRIPADLTRLKASGQVVQRPVVFLLTGGRPSDDPDWRAAHRRLVDRSNLGQSTPTIMAYGIGNVRPGILAEVATKPGLAFLAGPDRDVRDSIGRFFDAVVEEVARMGLFGEAALDDQVATVPEGFTR